MTPYEVLRVSKTSRLSTIKKAFRRRAMETHPDRNGDPAEFQAVQLAWKILSDPAKRKRFDETGEVSPDKPDNGHGEVCLELTGALGGVIQALLKQSVKPSTQNVVELMRQAMTQRSENIAQNVKELKKARAYLAECVGRFKVKDGEENLLESITRSQEAIVAKELAKAERQKEVNAAAMKLLKNFTFEHDAPDAFWAAFSGASIRIARVTSATSAA